MQPTNPKHATVGGLIVPMVSPVTASYELDRAAISRLASHLVAGGVDGLLLLGTNGEGPSLSSSQQARLVEEVSAATAGRCVLYVSIGDDCLATSIAAAQRYVQYGVEQFVAYPPRYFPLTPAQLHRYYLSLAEQIPGSLWLYNIPTTTGVSIPLDIIEQLSDHPKIVGLKDSQSETPRLQSLAETYRARRDFCFVVGASARGLKSLQWGADGVVPSSGNIAPAMWRELIDLARCGEMAQAAVLQTRLDAIAQLYQQGRSLGESIAALKCVLSQLGLIESFVLPPLQALENEDADQVAREVSKCAWLSTRPADSI